MYLDEIVPGNPFRQDQGRKIWGVYWACLEWPGWLLARSGFWPVLGIMKSKTIHDKLPGGVSAFWKHLVRKMTSMCRSCTKKSASHLF